MTASRPPFQPQEYPKLPLQKTISSLPPPFPSSVLSTIRARISSPSTPVLIILDDDPTGTQTCHDIAVLTAWTPSVLRRELSSTGAKGFFILTNSRALPPDAARDLVSEICRNVRRAAGEAGKEFCIVLRGDSTLRGHFPDEPDAVERTLGPADAWVLAPFFFQGGRYTIDDVHYVAEGDALVPAGQTPFALDATFGYRASNLRDYVLEKAGPRFDCSKLFSITLHDIRVGGPEKVTERLLEAPRGGVVVVNAAVDSDMFVFAAGALAAEQKGRKYLYRTGAAFVSARLGIAGIPPLSLQDITGNAPPTKTGGLIIAGSYVPRTTAQLACLRARRGAKLHVVELDVETLIGAGAAAEKLLATTIADANKNLKDGQDVLVMTSRKLIVGVDALLSLKIGGVVAAALVDVVQGITIRPRYLIAKGGITSSDAATKGLGMKRAMILGQAAPGVPLWRCDEPTSRHAGVPYVVFPGNVGGDETLADLVERWALPESK